MLTSWQPFSLCWPTVQQSNQDNHENNNALAFRFLVLIMSAYLRVKSLIVRTNVPQFVGITKTIRVDPETDKFFLWATKNEDSKGGAARHSCLMLVQHCCNVACT